MTDSSNPPRSKRGVIITLIVLFVLIAIGFLIGAISIAQGSPFIFPEEEGAIESLPVLTFIL
jgi:hypothetical protein